MKKSNKLILGVAAVAAIGFLIYTIRKRRESAVRHAIAADEGYETAHDILFPGHKSHHSRKLRFGPVLPE